MLTIPKIRATAYAIKKHFSPESYELLRNPKGVSGENVHLIRIVDYIDPMSLDIYESIFTIKKDYSKIKPKVYKEIFDKMIYRFYDEDFNIFKNKSFIRYRKINKNGMYVNISVRGEELTKQEKKMRKVSHLTKKDIPVEDPYPNVSLVPQEHPYLYSVFRKSSFAEREIEKFYRNIYSKSYNSCMRRLTFWKTLWHNMSQ